MGGWCVVKAVKSSLNLLTALFLIQPMTLIAANPVSIVGWGVREAAMIAAFSYSGLPEGDRLIVSLLLGANMFPIGAFDGPT